MSKLRRKVVGVLVVLAILGIAIAGTLQEITLKLPLENVVQVKCDVNDTTYYNEYNSGWQGSGIFIRDNLILLAGHIVDGISDANVFTIDGKEYKAKSWYLETEADIGFIEVDSNDIESTLSFDNAKLGETVWAYGNPFGVFPILTKGIISATNAPDDFMNTKYMVITDTAVNRGNSGCPLFDKQGNILGICSWGYNNSQGMSYFVRSEVIKAALEKYDAIKYLEGLE
uniref:Putative trypsin-like peptidase domain containing protein n=1 Tax=viral metagenome TaxID=1070528 RepID=A0A6H2A3J3_9ZZZZ